MTVIAYDGRYLAADTLCIMGNGETNQLPHTKIAVGRDDVLFAGTGYITGPLRDAMARWWMRGAPPGDLPPCGHDDPGNFIVISQDGTQLFSYKVPYALPEGAPVAWGCGSDYATGAMDHGANAMEAVAIACKRDTRCGGPIEFIDTQAIELGVQRWDGVVLEREQRWAGAARGIYDPLASGTGVITPGVIGDGAVLKSMAHPGWQKTEVMLPNGDVLTNVKHEWYIDVRKPRKFEGHWQPECKGRLINATGCGACLRCNREWYAMLKQPHETTSDPEVIKVSGDQVKHPLAPGEKLRAAVVDEIASGERTGLTSPVYSAPDAVDINADLAALTAWVEAWNTATAKYDNKQVRALDDQLRGMRFPAGCELVADAPDAEHPHWRRRLVWNLCSHEATHVVSDGTATV